MKERSGNGFTRSGVWNRGPERDYRAGTNRMNQYVVQRATQGLANYILSLGRKDRGVAIAYDSRHMSPEFADFAALCLAANGIKAYVFESLRPTPELSFAVRMLGCTARH